MNNDAIMMTWLEQRNGNNDARVRIVGPTGKFYECCVINVLENGVLVIMPGTIHLEPSGNEKIDASPQALTH